MAGPAPRGIRSGKGTHERRRGYRIQVLDRAFQVLDALAENGSQLGVTELAARIGLHKSTTHRLIMVLESNRFVERDATSGKCRLGSRLMQLGLSALAHLDMYEVAKPHLRDLVRETGETAHLGVLRDGEVVSLVNAQSSQTLRSPSTVGTRTPAHCTSLGKSILAFSAGTEADNFLRGRKLKPYTSKTIVSAQRFKQELQSVRERGYAMDNEEWENGLRCLSAPVWDNSGEVIAAISIAGPAFRITDERVAPFSSAVMRTAARISASLGYAGGYPGAKGKRK